MAVARFGVSLEEDLLEALDQYVRINRFPNRSQAIRHLIQKNLVEQKWQCNNLVMGAVVLVYSQSKRDITRCTLELQIEYQDVILSTQHYFLEENCLEIVAVKGNAARLTELSDRLIAVKGIQHGKLVMSKA
ncbi:MAG: nickel-responsive transcriptional regulator NikR [Bacteroidales bacterium]|jgi:CopG family nickel-responsive transcriptional regulator|nr:nickel-responsive transcriptional regulator NikR [Bacteroidales bacterium]